MFDDDYDGIGFLIGGLIGLAIIAFIVYIIVIAITFIVGAFAVGGTVYGGCSAIYNYICSFKENLIDAN